MAYGKKYHEKNIEIARKIMQEYATTDQTWSHIYKMYDISDRTFFTWLKKYDLKEEFEEAKRKSLTKFRGNKTNRSIPADTEKQIRDILDIYSNENVTWDQACSRVGMSYANLRQHIDRYKDEVGHLYEQAKVAHRRQKVRKIQDMADVGAELAMQALLEKLKKRTVQEVTQKEATQIVNGRQVQVNSTTRKIKELDAEVRAIEIFLKMQGLLSDEQKIVVQTDINLIGHETPIDVEYEMEEDLNILESIDETEFEEFLNETDFD